MAIPPPPGTTSNDLHEIATLPTKKLLKDTRLLSIMEHMGSDLLINTFVVNFKWPLLKDAGKQQWNTSLAKINELTAQIAKDLNMAYSVFSQDTTFGKGASRKNLFLIRNSIKKEMKPATYILQNLVPGGHIVDDAPEISYLVNTNMDPWATTAGFFDKLIFEFRQSILRSVGAIQEEIHLHAFVACEIGEEDLVYGDHLPVFSESQHNYHLVVAIKLYGTKVSDWRKDHPVGPILVANRETSTLNNLIHYGKFKADIVKNFPENGSLLASCEAEVVDIVINHHFDPTFSFPAIQKEEYIIFGYKKRAYMSRYIQKRPDFHFLVELAQVPSIFTSFGDTLTRDEYIDLGIWIELPDVPRVPFGEKPPLTENTSYRFVFYNSGVLKLGKLKISRFVWFDTKLLNKIEEHHHAAAQHAMQRPHKHGYYIQ